MSLKDLFKYLCSKIYCNLLNSVDLTNREKGSKCLATSSLLVVVQLPPPAVMFCFKELLWASRILQAYIKCSGVCAPSLQGYVGLSVN